jgi:energy-coupling factor transport system ATP-binding protein
MTIEDLAHEPPQALSGGQRLRTAVASVLSLCPGLLLLDEPTSGQDRRNITRFMDYVKTLSDSGTGCVFITHDMETALAYADRVVLLNEGRMIANGPVDGIFRDMDLLGQTALAPPQALTLSRGLGLPPALSVCDLAETLKSVMAYV